MRYGFKPVEKSANDKLHYNLNIIRNKTVTIELLSTLHEIIKRYGQADIPDNIYEIIISNISEKIGECMIHILQADCLSYSKIYKPLYNALGLLDFLGDETAFDKTIL